MKINIHLNDNKVISMETESYGAAEMHEKLNDQRLLALSIGDIVLNKNAIFIIAPEIEIPNVDITMQNGIVIQTSVSTYNANEIVNKMNEPKQLVLIGEVIANRNAVKMVTPVPV